MTPELAPPSPNYPTNVEGIFFEIHSSKIYGREGGASSGIIHITDHGSKITWSVAKSPRVAEQCDVNIHSSHESRGRCGIRDTKNKSMWEDLNIIERVPKVELNNECHYLPHRPVIKLDSATTKIQPVFDASTREKGNPSLNDCLYKRRKSY
ncbi:uncharacterized protein TNCV_2905141 [Trichonephila clavipes]|nr:uncharacterized protein TNCV_2905141 [Trichonephila clavipes]